jgi:hypothetical protein
MVLTLCCTIVTSSGNVRPDDQPQRILLTSNAATNFHYLTGFDEPDATLILGTPCLSLLIYSSPLHFRIPSVFASRVPLHALRSPKRRPRRAMGGRPDGNPRRHRCLWRRRSVPQLQPRFPSWRLYQRGQGPLRRASTQPVKQRQLDAVPLWQRVLPSRTQRPSLAPLETLQPGNRRQQHLVPTPPTTTHDASRRPPIRSRVTLRAQR